MYIFWKHFTPYLIEPLLVSLFSTRAWELSVQAVFASPHSHLACQLAFRAVSVHLLTATRQSINHCCFPSCPPIGWFIIEPWAKAISCHGVCQLVQQFIYQFDKDNLFIATSNQKHDASHTRESFKNSCLDTSWIRYNG